MDSVKSRLYSNHLISRIIIIIIEGTKGRMESLNRIFDLLSEERRRHALYYLEQRDGPVSVDEVARQVADWETNGVTSIPEEKFEEIEVELHHNDLPKASEAKHIEYDPEEDIVEVTGTSPEFNAIISVAEIVERPNRNP